MKLMLARFGAETPALVMILGRLMLAWIFLHEGVVLASNPGGAIAAMGRLGVSAAAAVGAIALQLVAGTALATGWGLRLAAPALGLFCVATAIGFHMNLTSHNELLHFEKDLAIAGGLFALYASETRRQLAEAPPARRALAA